MTPCLTTAECVICYDAITQIANIVNDGYDDCRCIATFRKTTCRGCFERWTSINNVCIYCRNPIGSDGHLTMIDKIYLSEVVIFVASVVWICAFG